MSRFSYKMCMAEVCKRTSECFLILQQLLKWACQSFYSEYAENETFCNLASNLDLMERIKGKNLCSADTNSQQIST